MKMYNKDQVKYLTERINIISNNKSSFFSHDVKTPEDVIHAQQIIKEWGAYSYKSRVEQTKLILKEKTRLLDKLHIGDHQDLEKDLKSFEETPYYISTGWASERK